MLPTFYSLTRPPRVGQDVVGAGFDMGGYHQLEKQTPGAVKTRVVRHQ